MCIIKAGVSSLRRGSSKQRLAFIMQSSLFIAAYLVHKLIQTSVAEFIQKHDNNRMPLDTDMSPLKEYADESELG
jgi:hypothetical protein